MLVGYRGLTLWDNLCHPDKTTTYNNFSLSVIKLQTGVTALIRRYGLKQILIVQKIVS